MIYLKIITITFLIGILNIRLCNLYRNLLIKKKNLKNETYRYYKYDDILNRNGTPNYKYNSLVTINCLPVFNEILFVICLVSYLYMLCSYTYNLFITKNDITIKISNKIINLKNLKICKYIKNFIFPTLK